MTLLKTIKTYIPESAKQVIRNILKLVRYWGFQYSCPLCNKNFRKFVPNNKRTGGQMTIEKYKIVAMGTRANYACPRCGSTDKERLVWLYLTREMKISSRHLKILHAAPEIKTRKILSSLPNIEYISGDKFEGDTRYSDGRYSGAMYLDVTKIPFQNDKFDLIICNHVLEHVPDDRRAVKEMYRVLKPGGRAILQVPVSYQLERTIENKNIVDPTEREKAFGQKDHVRVYSEADYISKLNEAGFKIRPVEQKEFLRPEEIENAGLSRREKVYVAEKI